MDCDCELQLCGQDRGGPGAPRQAVGAVHPGTHAGSGRRAIRPQRLPTQRLVRGRPSRDGQQRPSAYLKVCPQGNGIELHRLNGHGSITAAYAWGAYYEPRNDAPFEGTADRLFLAQITGYVYPEAERFFDQYETLGLVSLQFRPDGSGVEERTIQRGFPEPREVETREFRDVDVSANWFDVPVFGQWEDFFRAVA